MESKNKFIESIALLENALTYQSKALSEPFYFAGIVKSFEASMEYVWKYFRYEAIEAGLMVSSPRDAIKQAANLGIIDSLEEWLSFLKARNVSVHNYISIPQDEYLILINRYFTLASSLSKKISSDNS